MFSPHNICQVRQNFYDHCFLGTPEIMGSSTDIHNFLAHRFEATLMNRVIGPLVNKHINFHEDIFRAFLSYMSIKKLPIDWRLGLYFLSWSQKNGCLGTLAISGETLIARVASRWTSEAYQYIDYDCIAIPVWPQINKKRQWFIGYKSKDPIKQPKVYKVVPLNCTAPSNQVCYAMVKHFFRESQEWKTI